MIARERLWWARHGVRLRVTHEDEDADHWFRHLTMDEYAQWCGIQTGRIHARHINYETNLRHRRDVPLDRFTNTYRQTEWHDDGTLTATEARAR